MELSEKIKGILLLAARESIRSKFDDTDPPVIDYEKYPSMKTKCGAFVTLTIDGGLKGCIGYVTSEMSLFDTVCEAARQAAFSDPRFMPLQREELSSVDIEISVLSVPEPIDVYDEIDIGKHGLILNEGNYRGLLLPQVATENNFDLSQYLSAICQKSGLPSGYWKDNKLNLEVFTANIFSEIGNRKKTNE